jgi:flavin reductase (DIM6/NTAB) family NADH-FMN oxidoreductase RutF
MTDAPFIDAATYRSVLGQFCTGVAVVTGMADGAPVGMAVGSFSSVSLDPALVGFFVGRNSSSWPPIAESGSFCVNVLGADQEDVCRRFAMKGGEKFSGVAWAPASSGSPMLDGVLAWIDCDVESVTEAGDHLCVLGLVRALEVANEGEPLLFFRGGHGRFVA